MRRFRQELARLHLRVERVPITRLERDHRHRIQLMLEEERQVARFHIA